jgi:hypothetical protein
MQALPLQIQGQTQSTSIALKRALRVRTPIHPALFHSDSWIVTVTTLSPLLPSGSAHAVSQDRDVIPTLERNIPPSPLQGVGSHASQDLGSFGRSIKHVGVGKFKCSICLQPCLRRARAEACENRHKGAKPYICWKTCGNAEWYSNSFAYPYNSQNIFSTTRFSSKASLDRHCASEERRYKVCENW